MMRHPDSNIDNVYIGIDDHLQFEEVEYKVKVSHHGSNTGTSAAFLVTATPTYGVISCGAGNSYGHPTANVLSLLNSAGTTIYRTDLRDQIADYRIYTDPSPLAAPHV